jgi:hypothetical protein
MICTHPYCNRITKRSFCGHHWYELPEDLRTRIRRCKSTSEKGGLLVEAREYFEERMIGDLEISTCRGRAPDYDGCGADIVWLVTSNGKNMPVNADTIQEGDNQFDHKRHVAHWATCPKAQSFRR